MFSCPWDREALLHSLCKLVWATYRTIGLCDFASERRKPAHRVTPRASIASVATDTGITLHFVEADAAARPELAGGLLCAL